MRTVPTLGLQPGDELTPGSLATEVLAQMREDLPQRLEREPADETLRLQATALESAADGIVITDREGAILWVNPAFTALTGYPPEEVLGKNPRLLRSGKQDESFYQDLWQTILSGEPWCGELINRRKDGSTYMEQQLITPFCDAQGRISHFVGIKQDITERKRAEDAVRESEERLRLLLNSTGEGIFGIDLQGNCTFANLACAKLLGYDDPRQLHGKDLHALVHHSYQDGTPYLAANCRMHRAFRQRKSVEVVDEVFWRKDGSSFPASYSSFPMGRDGKVVGAVVAFTDITEQMRAAAERDQVQLVLAKTERDYRILFERANDAIVIFEPQDETILDLNQKACELYGFAREELVGTSLKRLTQDIHRGEKLISDLMRKGSWENFETVHRTREGGTLTFLGSLSVIEYRGRRAILSINRDIRERKRFEEELLRAKEKAENATRAKSEFLANMSHEVRTPLHAIIGMTDLVLGTELTAEQAEYMKAIQAASDSLLHVINDILDFSKIEAGKLDLEPAPFSLQSELQGAFQMLGFQAREKGLQLDLQVDGGIPQGLIGDGARLRQVLVNLMGNAIKFTDQGGVTVRVRCESSNSASITLHFEVADTGTGVPLEKQGAIFEAFTQGDGSSTRKHGGTGLGLAICSRLVQMMGGRIWVSSTVGAGSTFHFTVTLGLTSEASPALSPHAAGRPGGLSAFRHGRGDSPNRRPQVLVVDDGPVNRLLAVRTLEKKGFVVRAVDSASEALVILQDQHFDLVLMDIQMPEMNGFEATRLIRDRESTGGHLPIVAMTAHAMKEDRDRCLAAGMDGYVAKPFKPEELLDAIQELVHVDAQPGP